jgi:hypothetical protein
LYVDKRINSPLIQQTIQNHKADYESKNHMGSQSIELNLRIYDSLIMSSSEFINVIGIEELRIILLFYRGQNRWKGFDFRTSQNILS